MIARRLAIGWIALLMANSTFAQPRAALPRRGAISASSLRNVGLQQAWRTRVAIDSSRSSLRYIVPYLDTTRWATIYRVSYEGGEKVFDERQLDRFGSPIGRARAQHLADLERRVLATRNITAEVAEERVPQISLYAQTTDALLHAIDAETGRTKRMISAGMPRYPSLSPGVNDRYVAIVNGSTLYIFDAVDEKIAWQESLGAAPGAGPALTSDTCYVPLLNGIVQGFALADGDRVVQLRSIGQSMVQPIVTAASLVWPTDRGYLYVVDPATNEMRFRLEAGSEIIGNAAHRAPHQSIVATSDGHAYSVNELNGEITWRFSAGDNIATSPVVVNDRAYVITAGHVIHCVDAEIGAMLWTARGVEGFLAVGSDRVYVLGAQSELIALDLQSGAQLARIPTRFNFHVPNAISDRVYLGTSSGQLVCLRAPRQEQPLMHIELPPVEAADGTAAAADAATPDSTEAGPANEPDSSPELDADPFGDDNPFDADAPVDENPFADGAFR